MLASHDLVERVPLERSANGHRMIQADKDDVELLGYLKLDILGVRMLSSMRHALDEIARTTGEKVDLDRIALDDHDTFELIRRSDTLGCFQIESPGQRELLQKLQPTRWEDLIVDISLFRPGPVKSDMITPYLRRRAGTRDAHLHPPGHAPAAAGDVRGDRLPRAGDPDAVGARGLHRDLRRPHPAPPRSRGHAAGVPRGLPGQGHRARRRPRCGAEHVWHAVAQFASFGFCKAHAAAFAVPTYQSAWLKAHYPAHMIAGLLTHDPGMYPRRLILEDARRHDIPILPLDVNRSEPDYVVEVDPQDEIRGYDWRSKTCTGSATAEIRSIMAARSERAFTDVGDFMRRTTVSRPVTEALAHAGAFDALAPQRRRHLYAAMTAEVVREGEQLTLEMTAPGASPGPERPRLAAGRVRVQGLLRRRGRARRARGAWAWTPPGTS